jgi:hypothetical protein
MFCDFSMTCYPSKNRFNGTVRNKQQNVAKKNFVGILKATTKKRRIQIRNQAYRYGSKDTDPYQNVKDPEHWYSDPQ